MKLDFEEFEKTQAPAQRPNKPSIEQLELAAKGARYQTSIDADTPIHERVSQELLKQRNVEPNKEELNLSTDSNRDITSKVIENNDNYIILEGRQVKTETVVVNPNDTIVWAGNPRNFEVFDVDTSDLLPHIESSGGNTIPVFGRRTNTPDGPKIEIIAGSRRRRCCITAEVDLLVVLLDCDDKEALALTEDENSGRTETSFIANCRWHLSQFQHLKETQTTEEQRFTEANYAKIKGVHLTTIQDYLAIGAFPDEIVKCVTDQTSWSHRAGKALRKYRNKDKELVLDIATNQTFKKANAFIKAIEAAINGQPESEKNEKQEKVNQQPVDLKHYNVGLQKEAITIAKDAEKIRIDIDAALHPRLIEDLENVIENFAN